MNVVIGLAVALALAWISMKLAAMVRERTGIGLGRIPAMVVAVVIALIIWFILRMTTTIPQAIIDAAGIGPVVGLSQGLRRPEESDKKK